MRYSTELLSCIASALYVFDMQGCNGQCQVAKDDRFLFNETTVAQFEHPWTVTQASLHSFQSDAQVWGMDDCAAAAVPGSTAVLLFGGKDKYGASANPRIYYPEKCACLNEDFSGCDDGCPAKDQQLGVFENGSTGDISTFPVPREDHILVPIGNKIYVYGGAKQENYGDLYSWDATTKLFTREADFPRHARKDTCGAAVGTKLLVYGGISLVSKNIEHDVWQFDTETGNWTMIWDGADPENLNCGGVSCPLSVEDASCAGLNTLNGLLVVGGVTEDSIFSQTPWFFDLTTKSWTKMVDPNSPPAAEDHVIHIYSPTEIYVQGGVDAQDEFLENIYKLEVGDSIATSTWTIVPQAAPYPKTKDHCGAVVNGILYSFFGEVDGISGKHDTFFSYNIKGGLCPNNCVGKGTCTKGICTCDPYLSGPNCNERTVVEVYQSPSSASVTISTLFGVLAFVFTIVCSIALFLSRQYKSVRLANLKMLSLVGAGSAVASLTTILYASMTPHDGDIPPAAYCQLQPIAFPIAFGLGAGGLFGHCRTVDRLFDFSLALKQRVKGNQAINFFTKKMGQDVLIVLCVQVILIVVWLVSDNIEFQWVETESATYYERNWKAQCTSNMGPTWSLLFVLIDGLILLFTAFYCMKHRLKPQFGEPVKLIGIAAIGAMIALVPTAGMARTLSSVDSSLIVVSMGPSIAILLMVALTMFVTVFKRGAEVSLNLVDSGRKSQSNSTVVPTTAVG